MQLMFAARCEKLVWSQWFSKKNHLQNIMNEKQTKYIKLEDLQESPLDFETFFLDFFSAVALWYARGRSQT